MTTEEERKVEREVEGQPEDPATPPGSVNDNQQDERKPQDERRYDEEKEVVPLLKKAPKAKKAGLSLEELKGSAQELIAQIRLAISQDKELAATQQKGRLISSEQAESVARS